MSPQDETEVVQQWEMNKTLQKYQMNEEEKAEKKFTMSVWKGRKFIDSVE